MRVPGVVGREMVQDGTEELSQELPQGREMLKETPVKLHLTLRVHMAKMHFQALGQRNVICARWSLVREDGAEFGETHLDYRYYCVTLF